MNFNADGLHGSIAIGSRGADDWRNCAVAVRADGFTEEYVCSVRHEEWQAFLEQLETACSKLGQPSLFSFRALEHGISLEIQMDRGGHVEGKYEFARDWRGPCLSGSFTADQTHLRLWAKELRQALSG
jgi:hypothetical protein